MRVVPIGRAVWLRDDERDGVYLAALVVTPEWACITAGSWTRDPGGGVRDRMWFCDFTATDDTGASYTMGYAARGHRRSRLARSSSHRSRQQMSDGWMSRLVLAGPRSGPISPRRPCPCR